MWWEPQISQKAVSVFGASGDKSFNGRDRQRSADALPAGGFPPYDMLLDIYTCRAIVETRPRASTSRRPSFNG
jgi:hypothetical protein